MAKVAIGLALGAAAMLAAPAAFAQRGGEGEWRQIRVDASPFDLATPAGRAELDKRVGKAVTRICGDDRRCRDQAWASAEDQVNSAIERDEWMRRLADERLAQLRSCGEQRCVEIVPDEPEPQPAYYAPPPPLPPQAGGVTVVIIHSVAPPPYRWRR